MTKSIQAVVFDIGNVLIEWNPERFYDARIGPDRRARLFEEVPLDAMNLRVDQGHAFRDTIYQTAEAHPQWRDEIRLWHDNWIELATPVIPRSLRLMQALRAQAVPVFSLTNFGRESYDHAATFYPFLHDFDRDFISGHLGVTKPDARIYEIVEESSGLPPQALLFTDDRPDNIFAASERGWHTHLFTGPDGLADRLVSTGLLTAEQAA